MIDCKTREELNALSKELFGTSSKWQKLLNSGYSEVVTEEVTEYVPGEKDGDEGITRTVRVPVKRADGAPQSVVKRHTVESVKAYMLDRKEAMEKFKAMLQKQQDEQKAKKEQEDANRKAHEELSGSAL